VRTHLGRIASGLDDSHVCDEAVLLELLALADRAEENRGVARLLNTRRSIRRA
jgi:hypothetical protein